MFPFMGAAMSLKQAHASRFRCMRTERLFRTARLGVALCE